MKPKKSLGQNFLTAQSVVDKIVETANLSPQDVVLEIGPGKGVLTQALLKKARQVIAVEKDNELIPFLKEKFAKEIKEEKLVLACGDILTFDFQNLGKRSGPEEEQSDGKRPDLEERFNNFKIVANIPYYITGEFLRKVLSSDIQPSQMVILVQKEVAERIAKSKKESVLSISIKAYGEPKYIQTVRRGSFAPAPKVDSAILSINNISKDFFTKTEVGPKCSEKRFFEIIKAGFAHKRKFLINNLSNSVKVKPRQLQPQILKEAFIKAGINEKARAEEISIDKWKHLAQKI